MSMSSPSVVSTTSSSPSSPYLTKNLSQEGEEKVQHYGLEGRGQNTDSLGYDNSSLAVQTMQTAPTLDDDEGEPFRSFTISSDNITIQQSNESSTESSKHEKKQKILR